MPNPVIFGDWGTSRLRLFWWQEGGIRHRLLGPGIGQTDQPRLTLLRQTLAPWRAPDGTLPPLVMCGMVGSRTGLQEVPYAPCPADRAHWAQHAGTLKAGGLSLAIAAGLSLNTPGHPPDVMRGEETQIFGALALDPALAQGAHTLILPGTHSKWARLQDGTITGFTTFPTGELFALLRDHSTLTRVNEDDTNHDGGFATGLANASRGPGLLGHLFTARSAQLLEARSRGWAKDYLSGLLIGEEIGESLPLLESAAPPVLIGDPALTALYRQALLSFGRDALVLNGDACSIAGLQSLHQTLTTDPAP